MEAAPFLLYFDTGMVASLGVSVYQLIKVSNDPSALKSLNVKQVTYRSESSKKKDNLRRSLNGKENNGKVKVFITEEQDLLIKNGKLEVYLYQKNGLISKATNIEKNVTMNLKQSWGYYESYTGGAQKSGAYIFRPKDPNGPMYEILTEEQETQIYMSNLIVEVHVQFSKNITQITRIKRGQDAIEVEYTVGPIPKSHEIVTRFETDIQNDGYFYTDSNGREFQQRKRDFRPTWKLKQYEPIAGNYYPVNAAIYIQDKRKSLSVLTDRSQGGSSIVDGSIELMVHRRTKKDDYRGVFEPLDETDEGITPCPPYGNAERKGKGIIVAGVHRIQIGGGDEGAATSRSNMDQVYSPLHLFFASTGSSRAMFGRYHFSAISAPLPSNIMLITFDRHWNNDKDTYLIRLGHQYAVGEDAELSDPVTVDIEQLFTNGVFSTYKVISVTETTLSGNEDWAIWEKRKMNWDTSTASSQIASSGRQFDDGSIVQLNPMEIRTFVVKLGDRFNPEASNEVWTAMA